MPRDAVPPRGAAFARSLVGWGLNLVAAVVGAWASWDFGLRIGGVPMAAVASFNGALICALLANALFNRLWRPDD